MFSLRWKTSRPTVMYNVLLTVFGIVNSTQLATKTTMGQTSNVCVLQSVSSCWTRRLFSTPTQIRDDYTDQAYTYWRRLRERWRSIVMSTSVCVCLSIREHICRITRVIFTNFYARYPCPWIGPTPVGNEIPRGRGNFGGFLPHWQCIVQHSI